MRAFKIQKAWGTQLYAWCYYIEKLNSMIDAITLEYPFFKEHECPVSNEARSEKIVENLNKVVCRWCIELDAWNKVGGAYVMAIT